MIAAIYARLNIKAVDRALQAQADRLRNVPTMPTVREWQIAGMIEARENGACHSVG